MIVDITTFLKPILTGDTLSGIASQIHDVLTTERLRLVAYPFCGVSEFSVIVREMRSRLPTLHSKEDPFVFSLPFSLSLSSHSLFFFLVDGLCEERVGTV